MAEFRGGVRDGSEVAYHAPAVLDAGALGSIREANVAFLELLGASSTGPAADVMGLPRQLALRVQALDEPQRALIAACPYSLFNLRFDDPEFWRRAPLTPPPPPPAPAPLEFARTAVFLGWHLAQGNELAAALLLGMGAEVRRAWRLLPLPMLERAAHAVLPHLRARWGRHPTFWSRLLGGGGASGHAGADAARLLGLQLLAAEGAWPAPTAARPD